MSAKLFVVSAPSGSGKTTLCGKLLRDGIPLKQSVSATTRPPREGEKEGSDYHFVSEKYFRGAIKKNGFLEYEENFGHFYGTPKKFVEDCLKKDEDVLLSIDVKGAMKVKKAYPGQSVLIFILPPSLDALKDRLKLRRSEDSDAMAARLKLAKKEMSYRTKYDYTVVNGRLDTAYKKLKKIVLSEIKSTGEENV